MFFRITRHCSMGCSHCLLDAQPDQTHMTEETLDQATYLCRRLDQRTVIITGGEPFEHPDLEHLICKLKRSGLNVGILSNGERLQRPDGLDLVERMGVPVQVTNDQRYYPRPVKPLDHPLVLFYDSVPTDNIVPAGRAKKNRIPGVPLPPQCQVFRSLLLNAHFSLADAVFYRHEYRYPASLVIEYDGGVKLGEFSECPAVAHVSDSLEIMEAKVRRLRCAACVGTQLQPLFGGLRC